MHKGEKLTNDPARLIAEDFAALDAARFEPFSDTFKHPRTGEIVHNHAMVPVRLLRALVEYYAEIDAALTTQGGGDSR